MRVIITILFNIIFSYHYIYILIILSLIFFNRGENATKKCCFESCNRYFHGQYCLDIYCVEYNKNLYCLECFKFINKKSLSRSIRNLHTSYSGYPLKLINRDFFLKNTFSFYNYYPQVIRSFN